jgi:MFS family permease
MTNEYKKQLEKNIGKYSWYKVFTKRVYLPLIAIQLVNEGGVTIAQLAIIGIVASIVQLVLQLPTGYIADKWGNKRAIILGASISATAPLFYIFMPNFWGGLIAASLFFGGFAFQSGAIEAFMHDTLIALKKDHLYAKVMGRAQSYGLIGNVVLIAAVPATYAINKNLPFLIGAICSGVMVYLAFSFVYPKSSIKKKQKLSTVSAIKSVVTIQNLMLFIFAGFVTGVVHRGGEYRELLLQDLGVAVALFGTILAVSSLLGAAMGLFTGVLDKLKPKTFYLFDLLFITSNLLMISTKNIPVVITGFILFLAYTRIRMIIFQSKLLSQIEHAYKATLISALSLFNLVGEIIAITVLARMINVTNFSDGYFYFAVYTFIVGLLLWFGIVIESRRFKYKT